MNAAGIEDDQKEKMTWGAMQYMKYGLINYSVQLSIALVTVALIL